MKPLFEWVDFMSFYFIKIDKKLKYNYSLVSTGPKGRKKSQLTNDQKEVFGNVFRIFENHLIQEPKKWVEYLESPLQQNEAIIDEYLA